MTTLELPATDACHPPVIGTEPGEESRRSKRSEERRKEMSEKAKATRASFNAPAIWMMAFGVALVMCAGAVNVVAFRSLGTFVSHVTGTTAKVGMRIEGVATGDSEASDLLQSILIVTSFIFGSFLCGLVIPKGQVHFGGKSFYGIALVGNSLLLIAATFIGPRHVDRHDAVADTERVISGCLAAMACGLQNAMCTMHFGAIIRTTHITGTSTDIGSTAGRAAMILLRRGCRYHRLSPIEQAEIEVDTKKLKVLLPLFFGFVLGCVLGALLHTQLGLYSLLVPAAVTGVSGALYMCFRTKLKAKLKRIEENRLKQEIHDVEESLERAHSFLQREMSEAGESSARHAAGQDRDFDEVDSQIGHALEVVHDVENTIMDLYSMLGSNGASGGDGSRGANPRYHD